MAASTLGCKLNKSGFNSEQRGSRGTWLLGFSFRRRWFLWGPEFPLSRLPLCSLTWVRREHQRSLTQLQVLSALTGAKDKRRSDDSAVDIQKCVVSSLFLKFKFSVTFFTSSASFGRLGNAQTDLAKTKTPFTKCLKGANMACVCVCVCGDGE